MHSKLFISDPKLYFYLLCLGVGLLNNKVIAEEPFVLGLPVDCEMGKVCTIHKYFDHDPGPGRLDYACGRLSLDGDTGADFRVPNYMVMEQGVAVIAAADGVVRATRDGMADISVREIGQKAIEGRFAGNAVVITHTGGWETQYSHLKRGSVKVGEGDQVKAGQVLGLIGLSGNTEFPHMEFGVRRDGNDIDPFVGEQKGEGMRPYQCGDDRNPLWSVTAQDALAYSPTGVLTAGFAIGAADKDLARYGKYDSVAITSKSPAIVFWVDVYGTEEGDIQTFMITAPDGKKFVESKTRLEKNNIAWFAFSGKKRPPRGWQSGSYRAIYKLERDEKVVAYTERTIEIK